MATLTVRHSKVSAIADSADPNLIQPSDWNDDHAATLSGVVAADISDSTATGRDVLTAANAAAGRTALSAAASGAVGSSGLTMATARLLGRSTASTGAIEEIVVGSNLTLSGGTLSGTGGGGGASSLDGLSDVTLGSLTDGDVLTYDSGTSQWVNAPRGVVSLQKTADQSISDATWTKITFDSEDVDNCGGHDNSTNNERITAPAWATMCRGGLITTYEAFNTGAQGNISGVWKNGATPTTGAAETTGQVYQYFGNRNISIPIPARPCTGGTDYWEAWTFHDRGSATDLVGPAINGFPRTRFWMEFW